MSEPRTLKKANTEYESRASVITIASFTPLSATAGSLHTHREASPPREKEHTLAAEPMHLVLDAIVICAKLKSVTKLGQSGSCSWNLQCQLEPQTPVLQVRRSEPSTTLALSAPQPLLFSTFIKSDNMQGETEEKQRPFEHCSSCPWGQCHSYIVSDLSLSVRPLIIK